MADIPSIEVFLAEYEHENEAKSPDEQGDTPPFTTPDGNLGHLHQFKKYAESIHEFERQLIPRLFVELFKFELPQSFADDFAEIVNIVWKAAEEEKFVKIDLLQQIPTIAVLSSSKCEVPAISNILNDHLLPMTVRSIASTEPQIRRYAHSTLLKLMEDGYISSFQAEVQVCPTILALSKMNQSSDFPTDAIIFMSKMVPLLGRDVTERVFLDRFIELCEDDTFCIRKACALNIGNFCIVAGKKAFDDVLLPCYTKMCNDGNWTVRKACVEVVMSVSYVCSLTQRHSILAPIFVKLLSDTNRWVQMSAFHILGPFISTFADPNLTNHDGDSIENFDASNETEKQISNTFIKEAYDNKNNFDFTRLFISDDAIIYCLDGLAVQLDTCDNVNNVDTVKEQINELTSDMENINMETTTVNDPNVIVQQESTIEENIQSNSNAIQTNEGLIHEDDELQLYNSYNYWFVDPNMPLDPTLVNANKNGLRKMFDSVENLVTCSEDVFAVKDEEANEFASFDDSFLAMLCNGKYPKEKKKCYEQDVVPQSLIDNFLSMINPELPHNLDTDNAYHCAYSLPAVALTLGSKNWNVLKDTFETLAGYEQYKVRRTVASSLHELAQILGPEIAWTSLMPIFEAFFKDLDEVKIGILKHLAHFLRLINPEKRSNCLPRLINFVQTDNALNWRFKYELAEQLLLAVPLFKPIDAARYICQIAQTLLGDKVAAVRQITITLMSETIKYNASNINTTQGWLVRLAEGFAHSKNWKRRQTYAMLCSELLSNNSLSPEQFSTEVMPHFIDLSWDAVANIRIVVARIISKQIINNEFYSDPSNQHYDILQSTIRRLQNDKDPDVKYSATPSSPINS